MKGRLAKALTLALLIWAVGASALLASCIYNKEGSNGYVVVNVGFKYGSNLTWYNNTRVPAGSTLFDVTKLVAKLEYKKYPYGVFIESINGVRNEGSYYWMWWRWDDNTGWILGPVGADRYVIGNGETYLWFYEDTSNYPPPKP